MEQERRYRRLSLPETLLTELFRSMMQGERVKMDGLPADMVFRWFYVEPATNSVYAIVESAQFEPVIPGEYPPQLDWRVTMERGHLTALKAEAW